MIIDLILDRQAGERYTDDTRFYLLDEARCFDFDDIISAMDFGSERDVQHELCQYCSGLMDGEPLEEICEFINSVNWK